MLARTCLGSGKYKMVNWAIAVLSLALAAERTNAAADGFRFEPAGPGEFAFDTGVLRGKLGGAQRKGFSSVVHLPSGTRLDASMGLLSHYRVFTTGKRYGVAAWEWSGQFAAKPDGSVELRWDADPSRPFELRAVYRVVSADTLEVQTTVVARTNLAAFESFLANYFSPEFTNALAQIRPGATGFSPAEEKLGAWQSYPRDQKAAQIIQDGRWKLEPNPVEWKHVAEFASPVALRRAPHRGLTAVLMSDPRECFALQMPHQQEGHHSVYFALFGRDFRAGETATARSRLTVKTGIAERDAVAAYLAFVRPPK